MRLRPFAPAFHTPPETIVYVGQGLFLVRFPGQFQAQCSKYFSASSNFDLLRSIVPILRFISAISRTSVIGEAMPMISENLEMAASQSPWISMISPCRLSISIWSRCSIPGALIEAS